MHVVLALPCSNADVTAPSRAQAVLRSLSGQQALPHERLPYKSGLQACCHDQQAPHMASCHMQVKFSELGLRGGCTCRDAAARRSAAPVSTPPAPAASGLGPPSAASPPSPASAASAAACASSAAASSCIFANVACTAKCMVLHHAACCTSLHTSIAYKHISQSKDMAA